MIKLPEYKEFKDLLQYNRNDLTQEQIEYVENDREKLVRELQPDIDIYLDGRIFLLQQPNHPQAGFNKLLGKTISFRLEMIIIYGRMLGIIEKEHLIDKKIRETRFDINLINSQLKEEQALREVSQIRLITELYTGKKRNEILLEFLENFIKKNMQLLEITRFKGDDN